MRSVPLTRRPGRPCWRRILGWSCGNASRFGRSAWRPWPNACRPPPPPPELWQRLVLATGIGVAPRPLPKTRVAQSAPGNPAAFWQFATAASLLLAASIGGYALAPSTQTAEPMMAALSPAGVAGASYMVRVDPAGLATIYPLGAAPPGAEGRALQLWAVAEGAAQPASLGLLNAQGAVRLRIRSANGTRLLVTIEPAGGSPTNKPTGPVVFAGRLSNGT